MRLWAEIYNGAQTTMLGLVNLASASIVETLDKAGTLQLDAPATDPQASKLMRWGRWAYVYTDMPYHRLVGRGLLMRSNISITGGQKTVSWRCLDAFVALQRANTLIARIYDDVPISRVIRNLIGLVNGWTVKIDQIPDTVTTSQRFDGVSVLEAISAIAELHGYHFRLGVNNQLVFGELGRDSGVRLVNSGVHKNLRVNTNVALIEALTIVEEGAEVVNWLVPISGPVDGALTLKRATRNAPYPVRTTVGPNGETVYYISDDASVNENGEIQSVEGPRFLVFPVSTDNRGFINAANVLYDWGATQLRRRSQPQINYRVTVAKLNRTSSLVGEKVHLVYRGQAHGPDQTTRIVDVDDSFWVTQQTTRYSLQGMSVDLELSNNSEPPRKPEQMIAQLLKRQNRLVAQMNVSQRAFKETLTFSGYGDSQSITFEVSERSVDLASCRVTIRREDAVNGPNRLRLVVDGVEVPGGPFLEGPEAGLVVSIDIADVVLGLSEVRGEHALTITALYGTGDLQVNILVFEAVVGLN